MADQGARTETLVTGQARRASADAAHDELFAPGARLGRFVIERTLGAGGMGTVALARDPDLDRAVAIKVLHAGTGDRARQQRLLQEARALARIRHPNVVTVHEVGEHAGQLFIVMELVDGPSLRTWLTVSPRTLDAKLRVLADAARGLAVAHAQGITHRDFKPENLMIDADGVAKVVDFGIAELDSELRGELSPGELTDTGDRAGTPAYMAPEQLRGEAVSPACDQYSWCLVLHEAITGDRPVRKPSLAAIAGGAPPEPLALPSVPPRVRDVLTRGLAPRASERFASMDALVAALAPPPHRRWPFRIAGLAALVAATAIVLVGRQQAPAIDPCVVGAARLDRVWSPASVDALRARLGTTFAPHVVGAIDARADAWRKSFGAVCTVTPQGPVRIHRMACLDDALASLRSFVQFWSTRADIAPQRATSSALAVMDPQLCETAAPIAGEVPRTPAEEQLFAQLQRASIARSANALDEALAISQATADSARALHADRVYAKARIISGDVLGFLGKFDDGERDLRDAIEVASRSKEDALAAAAWGTLIVHLGVNERRPEQALALVTAAKAAVSRLGNDRTAELRLHLDVGRVQFAAGNLAAARVEFEQAVAIADTPPPQADKLVGETHFELASTLLELGEHADVMPQLQHALDAQRRAYGEVHPAVAQTLQYLGLEHEHRGDHAGARQLLQQAADGYAASLGTQHPLYASTYGDLATVDLALGRNAEAMREVELEAQTMVNAYGPDHPIAIASRARVGEMALKTGDARRAIEVLEKVMATTDPADTHDVQVTLGMAYLAKKRPGDARRACQIAADALIAAERREQATRALQCLDAVKAASK